MPSSRRIRSHNSKLSKVPGRHASPLTLRPDSEESDEAWSVDGDVQNFSNSTMSWQDLDISELDEPVDLHFQSGDRVWVRTQENNWRLGKVVKNQSRTRPLSRNQYRNAEYYQVQFGMNGKLNTRKYFAPLNGEMKPDTSETRELLQAGGWVSGDPEPFSD